MNDSADYYQYHDTNVYSIIDDVDDYDVLGPSSDTYDETGYMMPVHDGSPGHPPHYMMPLPTPPAVYCNDEGQEPIKTVEDPTARHSTSHSPVSEGGDSVDNLYVGQSTGNESPAAPQEDNVASSSSDAA